VTETPSAGTRLVALLGDPVEHSLSPRFQNAAFRAARLDAVYLALRCDASALPGLLRGIARAGGAGNVTIPHKALAAGLVDRATDAVRETGACNTFWLEDGEVWGDNTDVHGAAVAIRSLLGRPPEGARVLLLGAGGAARAALGACLAAGAAEVLVWNRTPGRAAELVRLFGGSGSGRVARVDSPWDPRGGPLDLVVNATAAGLAAGEGLPLPSRDAPIGAALDLAYAPPDGTAWVRALRARSVPAADGTEMLLHQGAAAYARWWGADPPLSAMRAALSAVG
jgi:shikimate dehydrogenase